MKKNLTEEQFSDYLDKRILDAVKSYSKAVGSKRAILAYENIVSFCDKNNLSKNFVLLELEDLLENEKKIKSIKKDNNE